MCTQRVDRPCTLKQTNITPVSHRRTVSTLARLNLTPASPPTQSDLTPICPASHLFPEVQ
uniref:Uncharacterized protein n=1 Tax=Anguilla anguilla TaxID=7936 RepID=A0A0E9WQZ1_ANGAN